MDLTTKPLYHKLNNESPRYNYRIFVFGLKNGMRLDDHPDLKKLFKTRKVIISEHPVEDDSTCDYSNLHYHGLVELDKKIRFDNDRRFAEIRKMCHFFKSENCRMPVNFCAYLQVPPRHVILRNVFGHSELMEKFEAVTPQLLEAVKQRRSVAAAKTVSTATAEDINIIMELIRKQRAQSEAQLMPLHDDPNFLNVFTKRTFSLNFKKALELEKQACLDRPILVLVDEFTDIKKECMTPKKSADVMEEWCRIQNIKPDLFIKHVVELMDRINKKKNTLYLNGEPNSGKTFIAQSLEKAAFFYGTVSQGTANYQFMWQDCINKRLIVINEPYFDSAMIEQLKIILEGTGTFVHKKMMGDEYLRPTPVLMTSNSYVWNNSIGAKKAIIARCIHMYDNLKACPFLEKYKLALHPKWMQIFADKYFDANQKFQYSASKYVETEMFKQEPKTDNCTQTLNIRDVHGELIGVLSEVSDFSEEEDMKPPPAKKPNLECTETMENSDSEAGSQCENIPEEEEEYLLADEYPDSNPTGDMFYDK